MSKHHGMDSLRGIGCNYENLRSARRFGRIFCDFEPAKFPEKELVKIGGKNGLMDIDLRLNNDNDNIPAGFIFLGQFVDHDITLDTTTSLEKAADPNATINFRTPALELDNVYGLGPEQSPYLYNGDEMVLGKDSNGNPNDLPRNENGNALIGDFRNDENHYISQLQLQFLKFHNKAYAQVKSGAWESERMTKFEDIYEDESDFECTQRLVRWHYQWMLVNEYIPLICGQDVVDDVLENGRKFYKFDKKYNKKDWGKYPILEEMNTPFIPVEFSLASYRFGHAQVQQKYDLNDNQQDIHLFDRNIPAFGRGINTANRLNADIVIDWKYFFKTDPNHTPQASKLIDAKLVDELLELPMPIVNDPNPARRSLAFRNLQRGSTTFDLPSGQDVAQKMGIKPLTQAQLEFNTNDIEIKKAPLWYYILKESKVQQEGKRLGAIGARINAEVLIGLLQGDKMSYLSRCPEWTPPINNFSMAELINFANS